MKRLVVISDMHSGHRSGITPPDWQYHGTDGVRGKFGEVQRRLWDWYVAKAASLGHVDMLVVNGDAIDGKAERSGGTELLTADREEQIAMAAMAIAQIPAKKTLIIGGTPYHTGREEDWESLLALELGAAFHLHEWVDVDGVVFDFKHKVGSSVIPHGRFTAPQRANLWNALWAERGIQPRAQVIVRSHVHYYSYSGDGRSLVMTTPALQAWSKYGSRECEGTNDIGFIVFDCEGGNYRWHANLFSMEWAAVKPTKA